MYSCHCNSVFLHTDAQCEARTAIGCINNKQWCPYELIALTIGQITNVTFLTKQICNGLEGECYFILTIHMAERNYSAHCRSCVTDTEFST
jgi:hypothetical protein